MSDQLPEGLVNTGNKVLVKKGGYAIVNGAVELPTTSGTRFNERQDGLDYEGGIPMDVVVMDKDVVVDQYTMLSKTGKHGGWDTTRVPEPVNVQPPAPAARVLTDVVLPVGRVSDASNNVSPDVYQNNVKNDMMSESRAQPITSSDCLLRDIRDIRGAPKCDVVIELKHESGFAMRCKWVDSVESETSIVLIGDPDNAITLPQGNYIINILGPAEERASYKAYFANQSFHWVHDYYIFLPTND